METETQRSGFAIYLACIRLQLKTGLVLRKVVTMDSYFEDVITGVPVCDHIVGFVDVRYEGGYLVRDSDGGLDGKIWGNIREVEERTVFSFCPLCGEKL